MPSDTATLAIYTEASNVPVRQIRNFLAALDEAYNFLYVALKFLRDPRLHASDSRQPSTEPFRVFDRLVPAEDRLTLRAVEIESPGFWAFMGRRGVLEQIRLWVKDAHERRKDKEYRKAAERRSLELDNRSKELKVASEKVDLQIKLTAHVREQLDLARQMGTSEKDLRYLVENLIARPLKSLEPFVDAGVISDARMEDED